MKNILLNVLNNEKIKSLKSTKPHIATLNLFEKYNILKNTRNFDKKKFSRVLVKTHLSRFTDSLKRKIEKINKFKHNQNSDITSFLSSSKWTGIAAIATILCTFIAIVSIFR